MPGIRMKIENWFESFALFVCHRRWWTLLTMFVLVAGLGSQLPKMTFDTSNEGFLHAKDPTLLTYREFQRQFGRDDLIIIAIEPDEVFEPKFLEKLKAFHEELEARVPHVEDITSMVNARNTRGEGDVLVVEDLLQHWPRDAAALASLRRRVMSNPLYRNRLIAADGSLTALVIQLDTYSSRNTDTDVLAGFDAQPAVDEGLSGVLDGFEDDPGPPAETLLLSEAELQTAVAAAQQVADRYRAPDFKLYVTGSPVVSDTLKRFMMRDNKVFMRLIVLTIGVCLFIMFRRVSAVVLPLVVVGCALVSTLGLMVLFKVPVKTPTSVLPSFLMAVGVADSIHILTIFYRQLARTGDRQASIVHAMGHSALAVVLTTLTTAAGLASFGTARVAPIAELGIFASLGVLLALVFTLVLLPAMLAVVPTRAKANRPAPGHASGMDRFLAGIGRFATGYPKSIVAVSAVLILLSLLAASRLTFSHHVLKWLPATAAVRLATEKVDTALRGSVVVEAVVDTGRVNGLYDPATLNTLDRLARDIEAIDQGDLFVGKATSVVDILKEIHRALNANRPEFYRVPQDPALIPQEFLLFENSGSDDLQDVVDSQFQTARFTIKVPWLDAVRYVTLLEDVAARFERSFDAPVQVTLTGIMTLMFSTVVSAIYSAAQSYVIAGLVVTVMVILLIGSLRIGLLAMFPNLLAILMVMGLMTVFDFPFNLFTMLIGSIAIGLAVDNTIHFMHNFRRYFSASGDVGQAVEETLLTSGRALLVTTVVLSIGFFIYMFASMNNLFDFGLLTGITIILAPGGQFAAGPGPDGPDTSGGPSGCGEVTGTRNPKPQTPKLNPEVTMLENRFPRRHAVTASAALAIVAGLLLLLFPAPVRAQSLTARQIMEKVDARNDGDRMAADMEMVLIDKQGQQRLRKMRSFNRDQGPDQWRLMFFLAPADVKNTAFLSYDFHDPEKDDDQWLYLPALRKTKRIASSDKSSAFMGSDFSYADMTRWTLDSYDYKLLKEMEVRGQPVWLIECLPRGKQVIDRFGYTRSVRFVRQDNFVVVRAVNWVKAGERLKYQDIKRLELIDGIWQPLEIQMTTKKGQTTLHTTIMRFDNVRFNQDLPEDFFSLRQMEKGL